MPVPAPTQRDPRPREAPPVHDELHLSQRLQEVSSELRLLEESLVIGGVDARVQRHFREASEYTRQAASAVQHFIELQLQKRDPFSVYVQLDAQRVKLATDVTRSLCLDFDSQDLDSETEGVKELFFSRLRRSTRDWQDSSGGRRLCSSPPKVPITPFLSHVRTYITAGTVFTPDEALPLHTVLVEDGIISRIRAPLRVRTAGGRAEISIWAMRSWRPGSSRHPCPRWLQGSTLCVRSGANWPALRAFSLAMVWTVRLLSDDGAAAPMPQTEMALEKLRPTLIHSTEIL